MRLLQAPKHSRQHISSTCDIARSQSNKLSAQGGRDRTTSRHDAQMLLARTVSTDPYAAWLEQREADREREERRLNPRAAWDDLKTQGFSAAGRG
jgi:hypothetical protein